MKPVASGRLPGLAAPAGFAALAAVLAAVGELGWSEATAAALAAVVGSGLPALAGGHGWRRRLAELTMLPPAWALVMIPDPLMRRAAVAPLLAAAAAAATAAAWSRTRSGVRPVLAAALGVACRSAVGLEGAAGATGAVLAVVAAAVAPAGIAVRWPAGGLAAAALVGIAPIQSSPWLGGMLAAGGLAIGLVGGRPRSAFRPWGWAPGIAGIGLAAAAVVPFGLPPSGPASAATVAGAGVLLAATAWLPAGPAGVLWLLLPATTGPPLPPPPDHAAFRLEAGAPPAVLWPARGPRYGLDLALGNGAGVPAGTPLARLETSLGTTVLRAGEHGAEAARQRHDVRRVAAHGLPANPVWRPAGWGGPVPWRVAGRTIVPVADGERPVLTRDPDLDPRVVLVVETGGPAAPTAPRTWDLGEWLLAAAVAAALLQLLSGTWRRPVAAVPWALLAAGAWLARLPVEPVRLLGERFAVDLALAALLAAWLPAARSWLGRGRVALAAAALLLPLAVATPRLTPPLYGDEPFHLRVMQSLVEDRDLDLADDVAPVPAERRYQEDGHLFHSPALGVLLAPAYAAGGRTGALLALALAAAAVVALVVRRSRALGVPASRGAMLALALLLTYPLAIYATQIWPEVPGALAVALLLVLAGDRPVTGAVVAALAVAVKARLALVTLPVLVAGWWRAGGRRRPGAVLAAAAAAAAAGLAVGWVTMGHPFGYYRRLHHLLPSDPLQPVRVVAGLAVDAAGGLLVAAPLLLLGALGLGALWRRGGPAERGLVVGLGATVAALLHSLEWYGGGAPPARYLVPALPVFALGLGMVLTRPVRWRAWAWLLAVPSFAVWWVLVTRPHLSLNPGDGSWWATTALARRLAADARWLTPSLLVPGPAVWVAAAAVAAAVVAGWLARRRARAVSRLAVGVWLAVAAAVVGAAVLRPDRVVELEAAQVRRFGGAPQPPEGTPSRFTVPNGWRIGDGDRVEVPLRLPPDARVMLEGWLAGPARAGAVLHVRWDDGPEIARPVRGRRRDARLELPGVPGPGHRRLSIRLEAPRGGLAVLDRLVVER